VSVDVFAMAVDVRVDDGWRIRNVRFGHCSQETSDVDNTENDQHDSDRKFQAEAESRRNYQVEEDDCGAYEEDGYCGAESPEGADNRRAGKFLLATEDSCDRDDVVGIGGVAHPEEKSESDDREEADHC